MAMNHQFPPNIAQPSWWGHPPSAEATAAANEMMFKTGEKEHMFEKPLTPSDVGKLNRLVIPKQHAEKYFPLGANSGLLLSFEDESGKCWSFRYSYWNSSQSYVLTKGWSRYVKEKGLDAGDVVEFGRLKTDGDRMFIGCRRRMAAAQPPWSPVGPYPAHSATYPAPSTPPYQPDCLYAGAVVQNQTTPSSGKSKRLRLFGVNLEYQPKPSENNVSETLSCDGPSILSEGQAHYQQYYTSNGHTSYPQDTTEYDWSGDANQMRYHQG